MCLAGGTCALLLLALVLCQRAGHVDGKNDNYQMSDVCKKYFLRDLYRKIDGAVLTSQNERELDCAITFQTHSILQRFMLRFDQLQLDCNDHLYIYDGAHAVGSYKVHNCDHLKERSANKCYINNNEYEIGEILKEEDMNPCDTACTCIKGQNDNEVAAFECGPYALCSFSITEQPGCYLVRNWSLCCGFEEICPENPEDRDNTCIVNGETYKNGEIFIIEGEPKMICICQPGYQGENVPPFCHYSKHVYWDPAFDHADSIRQNCVPIFLSDSEDSMSYRCQDINDVVVRKHNNLNASENLDEENVCVFGNLTMRIGDKLSTGTNLFKLCVKCICEVPPLLTCQRVSSCWRMLTKD